MALFAMLVIVFQVYAKSYYNELPRHEAVNYAIAIPSPLALAISLSWFLHKRRALNHNAAMSLVIALSGFGIVSLVLVGRVLLH